MNPLPPSSPGVGWASQGQPHFFYVVGPPPFAVPSWMAPFQPQFQPILHSAPPPPPPPAAPFLTPMIWVPQEQPAAVIPAVPPHTTAPPISTPSTEDSSAAVSRRGKSQKLETRKTMTGVVVASEARKSLESAWERLQRSPFNAEMTGPQELHDIATLLRTACSTDAESASFLTEHLSPHVLRRIQCTILDLSNRCRRNDPAAENPPPLLDSDVADFRGTFFITIAECLAAADCQADDELFTLSTPVIELMLHYLPMMLRRQRGCILVMRLLCVLCYRPNLVSRYIALLTEHVDRMLPDPHCVYVYCHVITGLCSAPTNRAVSVSSLRRLGIGTVDRLAAILDLTTWARDNSADAIDRASCDPHTYATFTNAVVRHLCRDIDTSINTKETLLMLWVALHSLGADQQICIIDTLVAGGALDKRVSKLATSYTGRAILVDSVDVILGLLREAPESVTMQHVEFMQHLGKLGPRSIPPLARPDETNPKQRQAILDTANRLMMTIATISEMQCS